MVFQSRISQIISICWQSPIRFMLSSMNAALVDPKPSHYDAVESSHSSCKKLSFEHVAHLLYFFSLAGNLSGS